MCSITVVFDMMFLQRTWIFCWVEGDVHRQVRNEFCWIANNVLSIFCHTGVTQQRTNNTGIYPNDTTQKILAIFLEFSEEALFVALRNREACNPVLRTQAMSAIQLYMEMK